MKNHTKRIHKKTVFLVFIIKPYNKKVNKKARIDN